MNLFERFWRRLDEERDSRNGNGAVLDAHFTHVHPPDNVQSEAARDLTSIVRRSPRRFPPSVVAQPAFDPRPFCLLFTVGREELPHFHELFEQFVDKNALMAEAFLRLRPHCEIPYVLFLGENRFFLYDAIQEELLRWGNDFSGLEDCFLDPLREGKNISQIWGQVPRKTTPQRADELCNWLRLWKAGIGARTSATPDFLQVLMQKVLLLFQYDHHWGLEEQELNLRSNFLELRPMPRRPNRALVEMVPFDGVAWMHEAAEELRKKYNIRFLEWSQAERAFFALANSETRSQFSLFILELFLLSQPKFTSQVLLDAFSDSESRLKLWKFAVTETLEIHKKIHTDDVNVYEPVWIDLDDCGVGWALYVVEQTLRFWKDRCSSFEQQLTDHQTLKIQFDMFQQPDLEQAKVPMVEDLFDMAFSASLRIFYSTLESKATLEFLILVKVLELSREWNLPLRPLERLGDCFLEKERVLSLQEMKGA